MILSIGVYSLLAVILWVLAKDQLIKQNGTLSRDKSFFTWQTVASIVIFAIVYGVRYNVGVDNLMYIKIYEYVQNGSYLRKDMEFGFECVQNLFTNLGFHYSVFIGLWGALQIGLIYYATRRNKYLLPFIALFIVLGPTWLQWANIMRQAVVECAFVFLIEFVVKRKLMFYVAGVLLCCLIHKSALLLFPFYFILQKPVFPKNQWIAVGVVLLCTVIGSTPTWIQSVNFIESVLSFMDYDAYVNNFKEIMNDQENFRAWGPSRAGLWALYLMAAWIYPLLRKSFKFDKQFDIYFECFFFGNCMFELVANTSQIFVRPLSYFQSFSVVVIPICLYYLSKTPKRTFFYLMCMLAFFNTFWWTIKAYIGGVGEAAPEVYKFFFMY